MHIRRIILLMLYYFVYGFIYTGWLFHRSIDTFLLNYSLPHTIFLLFMLSFFFLPQMVIWYKKKVGKKGFVFTLIPVTVTFIVTYIIGSFYYYYNQKHLFDPFLQIRNPRFENKVVDKNNEAFRIITLGGSTTRNFR